MKLPINYENLTPIDRKKVREEYIKIQSGKCSHCGEQLEDSASDEIMDREINIRLFPTNFFKYPIHLHHSHVTGMTIGAVHCHCNAVLWQYHGE